MRILVNIDELGAHHGVAVSTFQISRELARRGHEVDVAYISSGALEASYRLFARRMIQASAMSFGRQVRGLHRLPASILAGARLRPDVVYDNMLWSVPWSMSVATLARAQFVGHMRGFDDAGPRKIQRLLIPRGSRRFIANSAYSARQLLDLGVQESNITVVYNGVEPSEYPAGGLAERARARQALGLKPDSFVLLYLGRIHPDKGIEILIEAIRRSRSVADTELLVIGRSWTEGYRASLETLSAGLTTHWRPEQPDVVTPLHAADLVVVPSVWQEPFGRVAIEALATGRPVLASRSGGLVEVFTGPFERFLVPSGDSAELAARIDSLRHWRTEEPELAEACVEFVHENFEMATMVDKIEAQLVEAVAHRRG
jgi:glycosyltransferase involved in cell wall biosynthesis